MRKNAPKTTKNDEEAMRLHKEKLATRICDVAHPYFQGSTADKVILGVINLAVAGWNLSLMPGEKREETLTNLSKQIDAATSSHEEKQGVLDLIQEMAERKIELYPDDQRMVARHNLTFLVGGRFNLNCIAAPETLPAENVAVSVASPAVDACPQFA